MVKLRLLYAVIVTGSLYNKVVFKPFVSVHYFDLKDGACGPLTLHIFVITWPKCDINGELAQWHCVWWDVKPCSINQQQP